MPRWLPDAVTLTRILLVPVFVGAAEATGAAVAGGIAPARLRIATLGLLLAIGASDKVDGYLARRTGSPPTRRGAFLDAAADRLVQWVGSWYFALRAAPAFTPLPLWFPLLLMVRDATLLTVWLHRGKARTVSLEHEHHGKSATVAVFAVLVGVTLALPAVAVTGAAAIAAGLAVYSTARYAVRTWQAR